MHLVTTVVNAVLRQLLERYEWSVEPGYELTRDRRGLPTPTAGLPVRLRERKTISDGRARQRS